MEIEELACRLRYWRRVRRLTLALLSIWLAVTLLVPWYARELSHWTLGRFPVDFWISAQGAIMLYVLLIGIYAWVMDRLDQLWQQDRQAAPGRGSA
ncbi:MAG: hypothetical protein RJA44_51 [Pseudomonadota bacterium]|jgi:putative solute:sodium symporter small subunit